MTKINPRSRRYRHQYLVMREMSAKYFDRGVDADWPLDVNLLAKWKRLPKYHGTKYRGLKRWSSQGKVTKGDKK